MDTGLEPILIPIAFRRLWREVVIFRGCKDESEKCVLLDI
jgi:hypothetical protein